MNSQNYNRYGYCWNNPLRFSDPSGEIVWFVPLIYAAINVAVDLAINNGNMNFGQILMSAGQGALSGILGGATTIGGAFIGAAVSQVNRFMPAMPIYQSEGFNFSISPFLAFGSSGLSSGINLNFSGQIGDFVYSGGYGVGTNSGMSSLGESAGPSNFNNWSIFAGYNDGSYNYGLGYSHNSFDGKTAQSVHALHFQVGQLGLRIDEDWPKTDESRTGGVFATFQANDNYTFAFGISMITGRGIEDVNTKKINPLDKRPTYGTELNPTLRGGIMYGGVIHRGNAYLAGHNSERRLHKVQNAIHDTEIFETPYFADRYLPSKFYSYYGTFSNRHLFY